MRLGKYLSSLTKPEIDELKKICNFTEDEETIFTFLSKGLLQKEIALKMNISISTIERKVVDIKRKLSRLRDDFYD